MPIIPALRRLRLEGHKFQASLGYIVRPSLKKKEKRSVFGTKFEDNFFFLWH
jgi:hypothetical protein